MSLTEMGLEMIKEREKVDFVCCVFCLRKKQVNSAVWLK